MSPDPNPVRPAAPEHLLAVRLHAISGHARPRIPLARAARAGAAYLAGARDSYLGAARLWAGLHRWMAPRLIDRGRLLLSARSQRFEDTGPGAVRKKFYWQKSIIRARTLACLMTIIV